jgi:hypothetical protein
MNSINCDLAHSRFLVASSSAGLLRHLLTLSILTLVLAGCETSGGSSNSVASSTSSGSSASSGSTTVAPVGVTSPTPPTSTPVPPTTPPNPTPVPPTTPAPPANPSATVKSISSWVSCDGTSDQWAGVAKAFAAAKNGAFTLSVDCPVRIHIGMDIARPIFIDDATTVEFVGSGKFTVDNTFIPAFVIANSSAVTLTNWIVEYEASLPVDPNTGGYVQNGTFVAGEQPAGAFNGITMTQWLSANRGIVFDQSQGYLTSRWADTTNMCAMFLIIGDSSNLTVTGMQVSVPAAAGGDSFVPVVFSTNPDFKSNQKVTAATPYTAQYFAIPHALTFSNISLDGTYMGWVGGMQNASFDNIRSARYGDLQDAQGKNVGGIGKWFAPPHLFYINYLTTGDPALFNKNIEISQVVDRGVRIGTARDAAGAKPLSGYALSLKIGCVSCSVDNYVSSRPDGFLDVLTSTDLSISNVVATYNSAFLNNNYPGWRFPEPPYSNVSFKNISLTDTAESTVFLPIGNSYEASNENLTLSGVNVTLNQWAGAGQWPTSTIAGQNNQMSFNYLIKQPALKITAAQSATVGIILQASPATPDPGQSVKLDWYSMQANSCTASGGWTGALPMGGTRTLKVASAGNYAFSIECRNSSAASNTTMDIATTP